MKEEDTILKKVGTGSPFRVPEGYFENITSEIMPLLPEKEKTDFDVHNPTVWQKIKPWLYMAAMFVSRSHYPRGFRRQCPNR